MIAANNNDRAAVTLDAGDEAHPLSARIDADGWLILSDHPHGNNVLVLTPGQAEQLQKLIEKVRA